jgi:hypothetical protein
MNGKLIRQFDPTEPGDTLIRLNRDTEPDEETPIIIMIDEVDIMIRRIIDQKITLHKDIPTLVKDKRELRNSI